jgi:hypothetical protein
LGAGFPGPQNKTDQGPAKTQGGRIQGFAEIAEWPEPLVQPSGFCLLSDFGLRKSDFYQSTVPPGAYALAKSPRWAQTFWKAWTYWAVISLDSP